MKILKNNMDERQTAESNRVSAKSFWIAYAGLAAAIIAQLFVFRLDITHIAGELIVLLICCLYVVVGYYRRGIWDGFTKPGVKAYLGYSFVFVFLLCLPLPLSRYFRDGAPLLDCLGAFAKYFLILFPLAFAAIAVSGALTKKKQKKLAEQYADDEKAL